MTGHLLYGSWQRKGGKWISDEPGPLNDPMNKFLRVVFFIDKNSSCVPKNKDGKGMLALSDLRKFAKVELWEKNKLYESEEFRKIGPEPLEKEFTYKKFREIIKGGQGTFSKKRGKIKQVLMNPEKMAGIGNIYSDEILWASKVHPNKDASKLSEKEVKLIYKKIREVLIKAVSLRGESFSDFRDLQGEKGFYETEKKVYQREGESCFRCGKRIKRIKVGGRSAHFCPHCQKI